MSKASRSIVFVCTCAALQSLAAPASAQTWSSSSSCGCNAPSVTSTMPGSMYPTNAFWQRPTPVYASSWAQVPVTNYRPVVATDPFSGVGVSTIQPCNTYERQLRRTPQCSLWQRIVEWWRNHRCRRCRPTPQPCPPTCGTTSGWTLSSTTTPTTSSTPYYVPATENALVPIPNGAAAPARISPSPVPADRRPQLDPNNAGINRGGEAFVSPTTDEIFVSTVESQEAAVELVAPQLTPSVHEAPAPTADQSRQVPALLSEPNLKTAETGSSQSQLVPISWNMPAKPLPRTIPTDRVWDDSGWKGAQ